MNTGQLEAITIRNVDGNWQTVSLENTYVSPVVVCTHNLAASTDNPAVVRVQNAAGGSFELRLQEPRNSASVTAATVYCLVAEEGANELADGRLFEARTVISDEIAGNGIPGPDWNGRGENVSAALTNTYTNPVVLGQVMTFNDPNFSIFWSYDCENKNNPPFDSGFADGICVGKHIGEDSVQTRANETLGYFVIEGGSGSSGTISYESALGSDTILGVTDNPPYNYTLGQTYNFGVAVMEAMDGGNGGFGNLFGSNPFLSGQLGLAIDEDQINDAERNRTTDQLGFWVFKESDYGDAPDSYSTLDASGGPEHLIQSGFSISAADDIFIGSSSTSELDGNPATEGDPATNDTDDGNISFPLTPIDFAAGDSYTVSVPYTGNARLCGWIDFDYNNQSGDGTFDTDERSCIDTSTCSGSGTTGNCDLVFTAPADFVHNDNQITYARFRIGPTATEIESPSGIAFGGEVEDYEIAIDTLPVTLSHFNSTRSGNKVAIDWSTSSELFNVGFQLWGLDGANHRWHPLHQRLIKSGSGNAVEPQSYSETTSIPASIENLLALGISSVDNDGTEHYYGPFEVSQRYGGLETLESIGWNHIRTELDARMAQMGYVKNGVRGYRKINTEQAGQVAQDGITSVVEFRVSESGLYRITASELLSAGIDLSDVKKRDIALIDANGDSVVRFVKTIDEGSQPNRPLTEQSEIYFYGLAPDKRSGLYTDSNVYRLVIDASRALNVKKQGKQGVTGGISEFYTDLAVVENDAQYILASAADDPWLSRVIVSYPDQPSLYGLAVPVESDALWDQPSRLALGLGKSSDLAGNGDEHVVQGLVLSSATESENGLLYLDTQTSNNSGLWTVSFEIPANAALTLNDNGDPIVGAEFSAGDGYAFSEVHVDWIGLGYQRPYVAKDGDNHLHFKAPNNGELGYEITLPKHGKAQAFVSDGSNLVKLKLESKTTTTNGDGLELNTITVAALQGLSNSDQPIYYWVGNDEGFLTVSGLHQRSIASADSLLAQAANSNYLLIAHPTFLGDTLSSYAVHKQSQGYTTSIINYLDIVDAFGGGQAGPAGLTHYLEAVEAEYGQLDHVLLVGGSTYDHTDIQQTGAVTFIPGHYGQSDYSQYTVSDVPYITNSDNALFASIGRWPVRSQADLETIVLKSITWSEKDHSQGDVLLIAEHTVAGENIDFGEALDSQIESQLPGSWSRAKVYVDELMRGDDDLEGTADDLTQVQALVLAKSQIIDQLNNTPDLVLFNGHASTRQLSNQNLFKAGDLSQVTSSGAEMWLPMSCYVTFYESTHVNTLAHQLLFSGNAVNITGAMLLSNQSENLQMGSAILHSTMTNGDTIGEAVNQAKADQNNAQLNINWATLGDPTAVINTQ